MFKELERLADEDFCVGEYVRIHPLHWEMIKDMRRDVGESEAKYGGRMVRIFDLNREDIYVDEGPYDTHCHPVPVRLIIKLE